MTETIEKSIFSEAHKKAIGDGRRGATHSKKTKKQMSDSQKAAWAKRKAAKALENNDVI
jgi:hypothetical protein